MATYLLQLLFFGGQVLAIAFLVYGAWLCLSAGRGPRKDSAPAAEKPAASASGAAKTRQGDAWA